MAIPEQPIDISTRPFLSDLGPGEERRPTGHTHILEAVTGSRPDPQRAPGHSSDDVPVSVAPATRQPLPESRFAPSIPPAAAPQQPVPSSPQAEAIINSDVDWRLVRRHVQELDLGTTGGRAREGFDIATASGQPETPEELAALKQIEQLVEQHVTQQLLQQGDAADWSLTHRRTHIQAVFDEAFRYGSLSTLLREDVENIDIRGYDQVTVTFPDGRKEKRPPVATSDEELEELIARIATDRGRQFARPHGKIRLDLGGARLTALGAPAILPRPRVAVRKHRHVDTDLAQLVELGTLTLRMAEFLTASMRAYLSHLLSGFPGSGKTTFMRALAAALPPEEPIVTIETERELYLDKLPERHHAVDPLQYLPDANTGDDRTAAFTLDTGIEYALRLNSQVLLFGEILGPAEAASAIKALQAGKGASSTIHTESAFLAIQRLATLLTEASGLSDDSVPQRQIMYALDLIVQLDLVPTAGGHRRVVSEISQVIPGDIAAGRDPRPIVKPIFVWREESQQHEFIETPSPRLLRRLRRGGLREDFFEERDA
ncbi:MAG: ATPase, T2SS/T4P/T4SS family [Protaetiibacter sp.]